MKYFLLFVTLVLTFFLPVSDRVQADPGTTAGKTETLTAFFESWTESGVQADADKEPLPTADPGM